MKDLISATSILIASVILVFCVFQDIHFESALLRAGISFISTYSIGIISLTLFKVTVKTEDDESEDELEDADEEADTNEDSEQDEVTAQPENVAA